MAISRGCIRQRPAAVPWAVGAYITSAYWFTASTSFANPAVTLARCASNTFAGIRPDDAPAFITAELMAHLRPQFYSGGSSRLHRKGNNPLTLAKH